MRWRHAWIIKRRTFWSLLFQHLPRSFKPLTAEKIHAASTALGTGTWCVWSKRKQQCHPLWCKDLESWESMENRKTNWKDRWHTHTRHSRVCLGLALKTKKPPNLGVAPFTFTTVFCKLVPKSAKTKCFLLFFLVWYDQEYIGCVAKTLENQWITKLNKRAPTTKPWWCFFLTRFEHMPQAIHTYQNTNPIPSMKLVYLPTWKP